MRKHLLLFLCLLTGLMLTAEVHISIPDPETWTVDRLAGHIGQTVIFDDPMIVCATRGGGLTISPRRTFSPTNQARPSTEEYDNIVRLNGSGSMVLSGVSGNHRTGETIHNLQVTVNSKTNLTWQSGTFVGNSRADLEKGPDMRIIDAKGKHTLLVCAMNLEYYLAYQFDPSSTMGPANEAQHIKQRAKTLAALIAINADIFGFVEIQQGDSALIEIATYLNKALPERHYVIVGSGTTASGSYTQSCYIYDDKKVERQGARIDIDNTGSKSRKRMQAFREKETDEVFIFSINHYKAKSGTGTGADANKGDGQGQFNNTRVLESGAVLARYETMISQVKDSDILIMGDLNAYGKEDPIYRLTEYGMTDLHRFFHADSSYSYTFGNQAGYLDHALCNSTLLPQVTGMMGYHINSDEDDAYTYDKSNDLSMFRCSDHDPVLVGLRLDKTAKVPGIEFNPLEVLVEGRDITIRNTHAIKGRAYYRLMSCNGLIYGEGEVDKEHGDFVLDAQPMDSGIYMLLLYANGGVKVQKFIIR